MKTARETADSLSQEDDFSFLDDIPEGADDYEVHMFDGQDDEGCEGGACKIQ